MIGRRGPLHLTLAAALLSSACLGGRDAGAQSNEELMRIIREQQRQIDELSRKVDALTGQAEAGEKADQAAGEAPAAAMHVRRPRRGCRAVRRRALTKL